jgi:hypothetical protein
LFIFTEILTEEPISAKLVHSNRGALEVSVRLHLRRTAPDTWCSGRRTARIKQEHPERTAFFHNTNQRSGELKWREWH